MKSLKTIIAATALAGLASSASAIIYEYNYPVNAPIALLDGSNPTYSGTMNFAGGTAGLANFLLANSISFTTHQIASAVIEFGFADSGTDGSEYNDSYPEKISAKAEGRSLMIEASPGTLSADGNAVAGGPLATSVEVDGVHGNYDYREAVLEGSEYDDIENGSLDFEVTADQGDVYLKTVRLKVDIQARPPSTSVPDAGSTLGLLGLGFAGLVALRRKLRK